MTASQPAFEAPICKDVGFRDLSGQAHWVFEGKREEGHSKPNALGELGRGAEERQRIGRNRKFLKEMMVNHGVDIEADLIGVLDLAEDFPGHVRMGFSRGGLHLRVDAESHVRFLLLGFVRSPGTIHFRAGTLDQTNIRYRIACPRRKPPRPGCSRKLSPSSALEAELRSQWNPPLRIEGDSRHLQLVHSYQLYRRAN